MYCSQKTLTLIEYPFDFRMNPPKPDDNADPSASLMNMMKQMYEEGDDDMKRTINKAWTESNSKRNSELDKLDL